MQAVSLECGVQTKMAWQKNGTPNTLTSSGDDCDITDLTAKIFNVFLHHEIVSGAVSSDVTFNDNGNSVYATRTNNDGGTDATAASQTKLNYGIANNDEYILMYMCSISGKEKLGITFAVSAGTGAGTAPQRREEVFKFVPSPDADITRIDFHNISGGSYDTDTNTSALGTD